MACEGCNNSSPDCGCEGISLPVIVGENGQNGLNNYQLWLQAGNTGTLADFLESLNGTNGLSAYEVAVANGFVGGEAAWLASLQGEDGEDGNDGLNAVNSTTLAQAFTMPAIGATGNAAVVNNSWMGLGQPVQLGDLLGTWLIVVSNPLGGGNILLRNPGPAEGYPSGISYNVAPGTVIGAGTTVVSRGRDGLQGPPGVGTPGQTAEILTVSAFPTQPPDEGSETRIFTDPFTSISYLLRWNGVSWQQQATLTGAAGTQWIDGVGDPNSTLPSAAIGTYYLERSTGEIFQKTGVTTWVLRMTLGSVSFQLGNFQTTPPAPGNFQIPLSFPFIRLQIDKNVELDYSSIPFNAEWVIEIENIDASSKTISYATGKWGVDTSLSEPTSIAAGDSIQLVVRPIGGRLVICEIIESDNIGS